jgi:hypothetical protein
VGLLASFLIGSLVKNPEGIDNTDISDSLTSIGSKNFNRSQLRVSESLIIGILGSLAFIA